MPTFDEYSIGETIAIEIDFRDHANPPMLSLDRDGHGATVSAVVEPTNGGSAVFEASLDDDALVTAGARSVELRIPPRELPRAAEYRVQAKLEHDGQTYVVPNPARSIRVLESTV